MVNLKNTNQINFDKNQKYGTTNSIETIENNKNYSNINKSDKISKKKISISNACDIKTENQKTSCKVNKSSKIDL